MSKIYIALIADAIASRELPPAARARLQADARTAVKDLNQRYRRVLAARWLLFRAVLDRAPGPAAPRPPAAGGRPGGRRGPAGRRSQRDLPPRPPHGLAPRGRRG